MKNTAENLIIAIIMRDLMDRGYNCVRTGNVVIVEEQVALWTRCSFSRVYHTIVAGPAMQVSGRMAGRRLGAGRGVEVDAEYLNYVLEHVNP